MEQRLSECQRLVTSLRGTRWATHSCPHPPGGVLLSSHSPHLRWGERHAGSNSVLFFRRCSTSSGGECTLPVSNAVLTISFIERTTVHWENTPLPCGTATRPVSTPPEAKRILVSNAVCFQFYSISPSLQGRRSWVQKKNQNLESAHPKNNGSILLKKCLDCWFVFFSSFSEGEYQNVGDKAKLGARTVWMCVCVCKYARVCANRELLSLRVQNASVMSLPIDGGIKTRMAFPPKLHLSPL